MLVDAFRCYFESRETLCLDRTDEAASKFMDSATLNPEGKRRKDSDQPPRLGNDKKGTYCSGLDDKMKPWHLPFHKITPSERN